MNDSNNTAGETFAVYLAKHYIGRKGFSAGTVPEAAELAEACDIVLTLMDGMTLKIICIVDRDTHPQKTFGLSQEVMGQIGERCLKYSGEFNGNKMPITLRDYGGRGWACHRRGSPAVGSPEKEVTVLQGCSHVVESGYNRGHGVDQRAVFWIPY